jgi:hypothetical protein
MMQSVYKDGLKKIKLAPHLTTKQLT